MKYKKATSPSSTIKDDILSIFGITGPSASNSKNSTFFLNTTENPTQVEGINGLSFKYFSGGKFSEKSTPITLEFYRNDQAPYKHTFLMGEKVFLFNNYLTVSVVSDSGVGTLTVTPSLV